MCAVRNAGKWRRETVYEKQMSAKSLYTTINFPILRYADVLLMYAEAINEYAGAPDDQAKDAIREIRKRAGVKTDESLLGDYRSFRDLVRNERGRELAFEGLRKWDLIRWGTFVEKMHNAGTNQPTENKYRNVSYTNYASANYANVTARHIYLPIPTKELAVNHAPDRTLMVKRLIAEHTMNTKRITYLTATLALATAAASCEHEEIYEPLEFSVQLAPTNTYRTGDPVVFNFSGNADFITVWTGDTGHEYKHRNRTKVDIADIESCELEIEISQQYGTLNNLVLFAGNKFAGLNGSDAATDRPWSKPSRRTTAPTGPNWSSRRTTRTSSKPTPTTSPDSPTVFVGHAPFLSGPQDYDAHLSDQSEDHGQVQGPRHAGLQLPGHGIRPLLAGFAARRQPLYP